MFEPSDDVIPIEKSSAICGLDPVEMPRLPVFFEVSRKQRMIRDREGVDFRPHVVLPRRERPGVISLRSGERCLHKSVDLKRTRRSTGNRERKQDENSKGDENERENVSAVMLFPKTSRCCRQKAYLQNRYLPIPTVRGGPDREENEYV